MPNNFVLVVMDNHQEKIWNHGINSGATHEVVDANAILLMGPGKGKASGVSHLQDYLKNKHPNLSEKIYEIERVDLSHTSENKLLAHARTEWAKYRHSH